MAWKPDYVTDNELSAYVRVTDSVDDAQMALAITAASRAVDNTCKRQFGTTTFAEARTYEAEFDGSVEIDDLMVDAGMSVVIDGVTIDAADYSLRERNAEAEGKPWTRLVFANSWLARYETEVTITATWGWLAVPDIVKQATLIQASRFLARRDSPYGVAGSPDMGNELRLLAKVDPDVAVILGDVMRRKASVA